MTRKVFALIIITTLLFSMASVYLIFSTAANPVMASAIPTQANTDPPVVSVNSPVQNQTHYSENITLSFTISKPESWIILSEYSNTTRIVSGHIKSYYYVLDGVKNQSIEVQDNTAVYQDNPKRVFWFSINLTLPEGHHRIYVGVEAETRHREDSREAKITDPLLTNTLHAVSEVVGFTVAKPPEPFSVTPFLALMGASAAFVGVGLLLYFKKCRH